MSKTDEQIRHGILGDINPAPSGKKPGSAGSQDNQTENDESMAGGSRHDRTGHAGSRDVTEGISGGVGTESGTGNYRSGTGATGSDIGNRRK